MLDERRPQIAAILRGQRVDQYLIGDDIGGGGFSVVFSAVDTTTNRPVALKVLFPGSGPDEVLDFNREGILLQRVSGASNVVRLLNTGSFKLDSTFDGGVPFPMNVYYHVMELAAGCLQELLDRRSELALAERLKLWRGVVLGIHQMHIKSLVHRDLKSANCLLFERAKQPMTCKVTDLGRSRDLSRPAQHGFLSYINGRGDLSYAPPEFLMWQGRDTPDAHTSADLYGLGSVLFELVAGQGITALALGNFGEIMEYGFGLYSKGETVSLSAFTSRYEPCFELFDALIPPSLRQQATPLLRQLCNPDPLERLPTWVVRGRPIATPSLEWLLRKADIMTKIVEITERTSRRVLAAKEA